MCTWSLNVGKVGDITGCKEQFVLQGRKINLILSAARQNNTVSSKFPFQFFNSVYLFSACSNKIVCSCCTEAGTPNLNPQVKAVAKERPFPMGAGTAAPKLDH